MTRLLTWLLLLSSVAFSATTTITDTITNADGSLATGVVVITPSTRFTTSDGRFIYSTPLSVQVVNGAFTVGLEANDNTAPPTTYSIVYMLQSTVKTAPRTEQWYVPVSASPLTISQVRSVTNPNNGPIYVGGGGASVPTFTGAVGNPGGSKVLTITPTGVTAGSYSKVTVNVAGQVTSGSTLSPADIPELTLSKISDTSLLARTDIANVFANLGTPATPSVGSSAVWLDMADQNLKVLNSTGTSVTVRPQVQSPNYFVTGIGSNGSLSTARPQASDILGLANSATVDATIASNIGNGDVDNAHLSTIKNVTSDVQAQINSNAANIATNTTAVAGKLQSPGAAGVVQATGTGNATSVLPLNAANGLAQLDSSTRVSLSNLPAVTSKKAWPSMLSWKTALATCAGSVAVFGDSISHGVGANIYPNGGWAWQAIHAFDPKCGTTGSGLYTIGNADGYTFTGTWSNYTAAGPSQTSGIAAARSAGSSATAQVTLPSGTQYDVYYYTDSDTSSGFTIQVDGAAGTVYGNVTSGTPTVAKASITGLNYFPHIIKITAPASGSCHILGISSVVSTTAGISLYNVGTPSVTSEFYNSPAKLSFLTQIPNLSLVVYMVGTNDVQTNPLATYQSNVQAFITYVHTTFPNVAILFVTEPPRGLACTSGNPASPCLSDIEAAEKTLAYSNSFPWLSLSDRWQSFAVNNALGLMYDNVHPSQAGHNDIAAMVSDFLSEQYILGLTGTANGTLTINQGAISYPGLQVVSPTTNQSAITVGDQASGTNVFLKYIKSTNQGQIGVTGASDSLYFYTNGVSRGNFNTGGTLNLNGGMSAAKYIQANPQATDPTGCTASYQIGEQWNDNTTNTVIPKICETVGGVYSWRQFVTADLNGATTTTESSRTITASATLLATDSMVYCNATTAPVTVTLPSSANGRIFKVKKIDTSANACTVTPASGTIEATTSIVLSSQGAIAKAGSDGTNYWLQ